MAAKERRSNALRASQTTTLQDVAEAVTAERARPRRLGRGLASLIGPPVRIDTLEAASAESGDSDERSISEHALTYGPGAAVATPAAVEDAGPHGTSDEVAALPEPRDSAHSSEPHTGPPPAPHADGSGAPAVVWAAVGELCANPFQPRRRIDAESLARLAESIRRAGVMQPILVRPGTDARYEIVAGERRWRAATLAGLDRVPVVVRAMGDEESAELALVENVQREDLGPMERSRAFHVLASRFGLTQAQIAERVGLERSTISNTMRLAELEPPVQELVERGELSEGHGKVLLSARPGPPRIALANRAAKESWTIRRLEREMREGAARPRPGFPSARSSAAATLEERIGATLGTKVRVVTEKGGKRGRIVIAFYDLDHLEGMLSRMGVGEA